MHLSKLRALSCWMLLAVIPASLLGADSAAAMLYAKGPAWINGTSVPQSSAIFPGDLIQTKPDGVVHINATGSIVMIQSDSLVKYEGNVVSVEHGAVNVATTKGMSTRAGEVVVTPRSSGWTEFEVRDVNGTVEIMARKGDVSVSDGAETTTLPQGQQTTRDDSDNRKKKKRAAGAVAAAGVSAMDSPYAIAVGGAVAGGLLIWVLVQGDDPASPVDP
ncbi:MAG TPA: hypothetical protein VK639_03105 [Terriglobales bacterium]|jgi:hypothetical protein|nr:hypothetical protein [Terriglobales bacterium]